jgi:hypothetical protein
MTGFERRRLDTLSAFRARRRLEAVASKDIPSLLRPFTGLAWVEGDFQVRKVREICDFGDLQFAGERVLPCLAKWLNRLPGAIPSARVRLLKFGAKQFSAGIVRAAAHTEIRGTHFCSRVFAVVLSGEENVEWDLWGSVFESKLLTGRIYAPLRPVDLHAVPTEAMLNLILKIPNGRARQVACASLLARGEFAALATLPENAPSLRGVLIRCGSFITTACAKAWLAGESDFLRHAIEAHVCDEWFERASLKLLLKSGQLGILKAARLDKTWRKSNDVDEVEWSLTKPDAEGYLRLLDALPRDGQRLLHLMR